MTIGLHEIPLVLNDDLIKLAIFFHVTHVGISSHRMLHMCTLH